MFKYKQGDKVKSDSFGGLSGVVAHRYVDDGKNIYIVNLNKCLLCRNSDIKFQISHIVIVESYLIDEYNTVQLNKDYSAKVSKHEVVVGCQTIPIDKVKEILKISESL